MTTVVEFTASYILIGAFDSRRRYVRRDLYSSSDAFSVPHGQTIQCQVNASGAVSTAHWRYSVNGYVVEGEGTTGMSFAATVTQARL